MQLSKLPSIISNSVLNIGEVKNRRFNIIQRICPVCKREIDSFQFHMKAMIDSEDLEHIIHHVNEL